MKILRIKQLVSSRNGSMLIIALVMTGLFLAITMGSISLSLLQHKVNLQNVASAQALHIAEAGVSYYRWVLYHDHEEYCNKETCIGGPDYGPYGPYAYMDSSGQNITGYYELYITPPPINGSTIVSVKSVGWVADRPNIKREIEVQCGIPSWSTYAALIDDTINYGDAAEVWGPIHSNSGVKFDGIAAHNLVSSSKTFYDDDTDYFGVYKTGDPSPVGNPPTNLPDPDWANFLAGRVFGPTIAPIVSFDLLDVHIGNIYSKATTSGLIFDPDSSTDPYAQAWGQNCSASGGTCDEGYHITFKTNNKFDISKVSAVRGSCGGTPSNSILTETDITEFDIPSNGIIFVKHSVWIDGTVSNDRVTVLAFKDPITNDSGTGDIYLTNDLLYTNYDGIDAIGLIAQRNFAIGQYCEDDLRIDAAIIAVNGTIFREGYSGCSSAVRNQLIMYGTTASKDRPYNTWTSGSIVVSGFDLRNYIYDNNLTYAPPPHYPTTGEYTFISWKEK